MNKQVWSRKEVLSDYASKISLQIPEAIIFSKYKEQLWDKRVLDLGCGAGRTTFFLGHVAKHYVGIDYSREMLQICHQRFPQKKFLQGDVKALPEIETAPFDFILFSFNGLDYIDHADRLSALKNIRSILKPGGLFVFSSHNRNYPDATRPPRLKRCLNPFTQIKNILGFLKTFWIWKQNASQEHSEPDYAIFNDPSHDYQLLTYHIGPAAQIEQLGLLQFRVLDLYDVEGNRLDPQRAASHSAWIYYVAQKL